MKTTILLIVSTLLATTIAAAQLKENAELAKAQPQILKTVIKVPTLVCGSCVTTVTKAVKQVDGVKTVKVDLKKKIATVTYASTKVTVDKLEKAISDAGYDANEVKRNSEAYEKLDACCRPDSKK
jgi:periplasmic mercuric ion binding protein